MQALTLLAQLDNLARRVALQPIVRALQLLLLAEELIIPLLRRGVTGHRHGWVRLLVQVQTPAGLMQVTIPDRLGPGEAFELMLELGIVARVLVGCWCPF